MFKFLNRLLFIILIVIFIYLIYFSIHFLQDDSALSVYDLRSKKVVQIYSNKVNFVWRATMPWWFSIEKNNLKRTTLINLKLNISQLSGLRGEEYKVKVPIEVKYKIVPKFLTNKSVFLPKNSFQYLENYLKLYLENDIVNIQDREYVLLKKNIKNIINRKISKKDFLMHNNAFEIEKFYLFNKIVFPSKEIYLQGIKQLNNLRLIDFDGLKKLKLIEAEIQRNKMKNKQYYLNLEKISKIISKNPERRSIMPCGKKKKRKKITNHKRKKRKRLNRHKKK